MKSLTIPSTVVSVGSLFVRSNIAQKDLIMLPATPLATNGDVTDDARYDIITLHVQKGSLEAYKQHPIWGKFTKILGDAYNTPRFSDRHNYGGMTRNRYICKKEENHNGKTI